MGRPKSENPLTPTENTARWRADQKRIDLKISHEDWDLAESKMQRLKLPNFTALVRHLLRQA